MLNLIYGTSAGGKSSYAEQLAVSLRAGGRLIYLAMMSPYKWNTHEIDPETRQRIERHRQMRADKGFETVECYRDIDRVSVGAEDVILLECMSNLLANEMYPPMTDENTEQSDEQLCMCGSMERFDEQPCMRGSMERSDEQPCMCGDTETNSDLNPVCTKILQAVETFRQRAHAVVVVTNDIFSDGGNDAYDASTCEYIRNLAAINRTLAEHADSVTELVCGIPVAWK